MSMVTTIKDLAVHRSCAVSTGADDLAAHLMTLAPFEQFEYASGLEHNGWIIPESWDVIKATIHRADGSLFYDGLVDPLGVISMSESMIAGMGGKELKEHCYYSEAFPNACVYHCKNIIQNWNKEWGFSMPRTLFDQIGDREAFHVELRTRLEPGTMKVLEWVIKGDSSESIMLLGHSCHPGLANDDLSGVVVGMEVMRRLAQLPSRRFTYRLLVSAEHLGPIFHLWDKGHEHVRMGLFLESLGSEGPLALQKSFAGDSRLDRALTLSLGTPCNSGPFRSIVGNCETVLEALGIPCPSLSRVPFPAYHTSHDNWTLMQEDKLEQAVQIVTQACGSIDQDCYPIKRFEGLIALSNPRFQLYKAMFDPSIPDRRTITQEQRKWNQLMDALPQLMDGAYSVLDIAERYGLRFMEVLEYLMEWEAKGLIELRKQSGPMVLPMRPAVHHGVVHG